MSKRKYLELEKFLNYYREFHSIPTWTKEKRKKYENLWGLMNKSEFVNISSSRDSDTTKVHVQNGFTIFEVPKKQLGNMIPYRGKWVLMYCGYREKFKHYLQVFPLDKGIQKIESSSLKREFGYRYIDLVE